MEDSPIKEAKAFIPMESVMLSNSGTSTTTLRRKAAKRPEPWYNNLASLPPPPMLRIPARSTSRARHTCTAEIGLQLPSSIASLPPPLPQLQDEDKDEDQDISPATKKPRLDTPITKATAEAEVPDTQSNNHPKATGTTSSRWTKEEEDAELTSALANTCKKKRWCKEYEYKIDWVAISAFVQVERESSAPRDGNISWTQAFPHNGIIMRGLPAEEPLLGGHEKKMQNRLVQKKTGKEYRTDWADVAVLVPGRTKTQCLIRWHYVLNPINVRATARTGI
jgi:hypothetical protein